MRYVFLTFCIFFAAVALWAGVVEAWSAFRNALVMAGVFGFCYGWLTRD